MGTIQCAAVMLLVMLDFAQAAFFMCAFDDRDLKRCAEPEAYHCQNLGETEHALHGCAVPEKCQPGEHAELSGTNEGLTVKCVACGKDEYQPDSIWSNTPRSTECLKHTKCDKHSGKIVYRMGNLTHDTLCKCNVEEGYYLPKYLVSKSPIKYTCSEPNCHCEKEICPAGKQLEESGDCEPCPRGTEKLVESYARCQPTNATVQPSPTGVTATIGKTGGVSPENVTTPVPNTNKSVLQWALPVAIIVAIGVTIVIVSIIICRQRKMLCWGRKTRGYNTPPDPNELLEGVTSSNGQPMTPNGDISQGNNSSPASQPFLPPGSLPPVDDSRVDSQMLDPEILSSTSRQEEHPVTTPNQSDREEPNSYEEEGDPLTPPCGEGPNPEEEELDPPAPPCREGPNPDEEEHDPPTCTPPSGEGQTAPPVVSSTRVQDSTGVTVNNFYAQVFVTNTSGPVIRNPNGSGNGNAANNCPPSGPSTNVGGIQPASSNVPATTNNRDTQPASSNGAPSTNIGRVQPASNNDFRTINSDTDSAQPIRNNGTAINGQEGQNSNLRLRNIEPLTMDTGASDSLPPRPVPEERSDLSSETVPKERYSSPEQLSQTTPKVLYTKSEQGSASS